MRFDPEQRRLSSLRWTGGVEALNQFSDGFPLLVLGEASLDELNARLAAAGHAAAGIERFRPNIVLAGLGAYEEDQLQRIRIAADEEVELALVKPCGRCPIPNIDPATAEVQSARAANAAANTAATSWSTARASFGMNAIVLQGAEQTLRVGQQGDARSRSAG